MNSITAMFIQGLLHGWVAFVLLSNEGLNADVWGWPFWAVMLSLIVIRLVDHVTDPFA